MELLPSSLLSFLLLYKYVALFITDYAAAVILPLPTNVMLLAVGAFSSQGYFNFWISFFVVLVANSLGDMTDYAITRFWGEPVARKLHLHKFKFYEQLREELRTDAAITVFMTRFAGSLSPVANFLAGLVGVPFSIFFWCDIAGNAIEPFGALAIGYLAGNYWSNFSGTLTTIAGIVAVVVIIFILVRIYRRMERRLEKKN